MTTYHLRFTSSLLSDGLRQGMPLQGQAVGEVHIQFFLFAQCLCALPLCGALVRCPCTMSLCDDALVQFPCAMPLCDPLVQCPCAMPLCGALMRAILLWVPLCLWCPCAMAFCVVRWAFTVALSDGFAQ